MKRIGHIVRQSAILFALCVLAADVAAQTFTTTTVSGTVYGADGAPVSGTLEITWPAFTTAASQAVAAGLTTVTIASNGFFSVNLAPNIGSMPAGLYYTAIYHLSDGTTSTEYWVVPAASTATLSQVRATVMPAAQAAQAVNKAYVDQSIQEAVQGQMTVFGGTLTGPLYLSGDPSQPTQAADKHYVDDSVSGLLPLNGGVLTGPVTGPQIGAVYQADQFAGADFGARLQACINGLNASYGGTCDARNFSGALTMAANLTVSVANATIYLPCSTISTAASMVIPAGVRNVTLRGCASQGTSAQSGSQGGTVILYSGSAAAIQVGDSTYAADTQGFHLDNVAVNTTAATGASAQAIAIRRTQEFSLSGLYLLGNSNQTGITLDGTGNYTGGDLSDTHISGFQTAVNGIGHQVSNPATTDWLNASTFVRLHIDCPTTGGNPQAGTIGINLQQGDGNTFTGGDVEGCATALHLGSNAQNNTLVGLRNENSTYQVAADAGSSYNNWITGGTMYTGKLTDSGTHNSFLDTFHRSFNGLNGDLYRSQADATVTNHYYLGTGAGNVRGLEDEYITDVPGQPGSYQNAWLWGPEDGASGQQTWALQDMLNNVQRFGVQQNTAAGGTPQTYLNAAGGGSVCFNCSANAGTGGVNFSSGGTSPATVATVDKSGDAQFNGTLQVSGTSQSAGTMTVRNNADAEVDYYLWPGLTASQKGSFTYKDFNGNSQWYMVKDASNNWALNSAVGGLDSFKAYQSTNSGDTYIDSSNASGHIRLNYETGAGTETDIYSGGSANLAAAFLSPTSIKLPGLASASGDSCVQIDNSGYLTNTGSACGSGGGGSGTVNSGTSGQIAYYSASGTAISGTATVALSAGGTGATTAAGALAGLGALPANGCTSSAGGNVSCPGAVKSNAVSAGVNGTINVMAPPYNAAGNGSSDDTTAVTAALTYAAANNVCVYFPPGTYKTTAQLTWNSSNTLCLRGAAAATGQNQVALSWIYYQGASTVQAALSVNNTSGGQYSAIDWKDIGFAANTNASYAVYANNVGGKSPTDNLFFAGGSVSAFEGLDYNAQASQRNWTVVGGTVPCVNGITFGESSGTYVFPSGQFTLDTPTVEYCTGIGLNFADTNGITVLNGQVGDNYQNLLVSGGQDVFVQGLYENGSRTAAHDTITGYNNVFIDIDDSNVFELLSGAAQTILMGGYFGDKLQIDSGAVGTILQGVELNQAGSSYFSDAGTGTVYDGIAYSTSKTQVAANLPQAQQVSQAQVLGSFGSFDPTVTASGTWFLETSNAVVPFFQNVFTIGKAWVAILSGEFSCAGCAYNQSIHVPITLSDSSNTVSVSGHTAAFQVDSTTGLFEFTSTYDGIQFTGTVTFVPFSGIAAGSGPGAGIAPVSLQLGSSGTAMTASAGNGGAAQETTSATKTAGHAASFDSNGNVVDSGYVAGSAASMTGGAVNDIPYQTGAGATSFLTPVDNAVVATNSSGVPSETTTLPAVSGVNLTALPSNAALYPTLNQNTTGNAATATVLANGAVDDIPYQTGPGATSFVTPVDNAVVATNSSGVPSESTTLPSGLSATNLTLTTPALGTPASGVITNLTGTCTNCTAANISATTNATLATLSALSLPYTQLSGAPSSLPPNGAAGGDLTGSYPGPTVAGVNGGSIPTAKTIVGTNSSGQIVDASSATLANSTTGNAATSTSVAGMTTDCSLYQSAAGTTACATAPTTANTFQVLAEKPNGSAAAPGFANETALMWSPSPQFYSITSMAFAQNKITYFAFTLPIAVYTGHVSYQPYTADNTANDYDIGIYSISGSTATLVTHIGATAGTTFAPSTGGAIYLAWTGGSVLLTPGTYLFAETTSCASSCAALRGEGAAAGPTVYGSTSGTGTTSGGVLSSSISSLSAAGTTVTMPNFMLY